MPELPEVELIRRYIDSQVAGKRIGRIDSLLPRMWRNTTAEVASQILTDAVITGVKRRGKYLVLSMEDGTLLIVHLKLTGRLIYRSTPRTERFDRVLFYLDDGSVLAFGDIRTLGALYLFASAKDIDLPGLLQMGVEPLSTAFTGAKLYAMTSRHSTPIKVFLLNQKYVAGIGNIYADEALFLARIHPRRRADSLTEKECASLHRAIRKVLRDSLERGGTSFRDYRNGEGKAGHNQEYLAVYGRAGKPCVRCKRILEDTVLGGRHTVYCSHCQK